MDNVATGLWLYLMTSYLYGFAGLVWFLSEPRAGPLPLSRHAAGLVVFAASPLVLAVDVTWAVVRYAQGRPL